MTKLVFVSILDSDSEVYSYSSACIHNFTMITLYYLLQ